MVFQESNRYANDNFHKVIIEPLDPLKKLTTEPIVRIGTPVLIIFILQVPVSRLLISSLYSLPKLSLIHLSAPEQRKAILVLHRSATDGEM